MAVPLRRVNHQPFPQQTLHIPPGKKLFLATDFHLGSPNHQLSLIREKRVVAWLERIGPSASHIFLLGDVFDFWFEYRTAIPKGFVRLQGALARLADSGVKISLFTGNHDMWMFDYLPLELGVEIVRVPTTYIIAGQKFLIGHGDGLGPGDTTYKLLRSFFRSRLCQVLFSWLHPSIGMAIGQGWSSKSRASHGHKDAEFKGQSEYIYQYLLSIQQSDPHNQYIFGHRHLPINMTIGPASQYLNLGDWFNDRASYFATIDSDANLQVLHEDGSAANMQDFHSLPLLSSSTI